MVSSKTKKLIALEILQWSAFVTVLCVTAQKLATVEGLSSYYWLVVSVSLSYVAAVTLLVWIPVKLVFQWMQLWSFRKGEWCPAKFVYVLTCACPCTIMIMVAVPDHIEYFQLVCVELLVIMLVVVDWAEKLKKYKLRSEEDKEEDDGEVAGMSDNGTQLRYTLSGGYTGHSSVGSTSDVGWKSFASLNDPRSIDMSQILLNAFDIRLVLSLVYCTDPIKGWSYAIYSIAFFAMVSLIFTRKCYFRSIIGIVLLEIPFFCIRIAVYGAFGYGYFNHALFLLKNFFVVASFLYFNIIRRLLFSSATTKPQLVNTISKGNHNEANSFNHLNSYHANYWQSNHLNHYEVENDHNELQDYQEDHHNYHNQPHSDTQSHYNDGHDEEIQGHFDESSQDDIQDGIEIPNNDGGRVRIRNKITKQESILRKNFYEPPDEDEKQGDEEEVKSTKDSRSSKKTTDTRRVAPSIPTSAGPSAALHSSHDNDDESFPQPPDHMLDLPDPSSSALVELVTHNVGPHKVSVWNECTPDKAAQLARAASLAVNRKTNQQEAADE